MLEQKSTTVIKLWPIFVSMAMLDVRKTPLRGFIDKTGDQVLVELTVELVLHFILHKWYHNVSEVKPELVVMPRSGVPSHLGTLNTNPPRKPAEAGTWPRQVMSCDQEVDHNTVCS